MTTSVMPDTSSQFNRRWARLLLETLTRHGVGHICIAPGSRSTPLTLAAAEHPSILCHTHFDERGLGHLALGLAKATRRPVAVIVTSGTAAANLYPAVIEASLTGEKLIMLTADRPPELIDCGANQAIRQPGLFAGFAVQRVDLPRPTPDIPAGWLVSTLDRALADPAPGAVHINCPFAEPLYGADDTGREDPWSRTLGDWWQGNDPWLKLPGTAAPASEPDWASWRGRKGVVIAGRIPCEQGARLAEWAAELGWPLIGDVLSQTGQPLPYADLWLAHPDARQVLRQAELVVQFGGSLTGKRLLQWQEQCRPAEYWLVDPLPGRLDPAHHRGRRISAPIGAWLDHHPAIAQAPWAASLAGYAGLARARIEAALGDGLGEAQLACRLNDLLPADGRLFLGNSLTIRLVDALAQLPAGYPVYGNRGASGIDGLLSTAAGVQRADDRPLLALVGDLSALYDLNALALFRRTTAPVVIVVVNNNGGQIFSLLPTPEAVRERFYVMPQQVEFRHAAALFGLDYAQPDTPAGLRACVRRAWSRPGGGAATLLELKVQPHEGADVFRQLVSGMARP
ncbi:2-succinyl-5-enolpyruvyl-6-hydroxy-3-cyclohexene-1-carboxylic-acid synthase [Acerihabitans arboris]|uniref:2-succinyl-5-enolpyruvyl-6-hydroxy-3-cyclohexene-1-carboxylate synthase n=1 Tax=Acerihabitans arboris TaxID=2691583 RepID=A0A845SPJ0_9GAMM|nr:2-succinyl-5-enolpyruvyl-6-hydroxy-3-cyclohexene-1-carboxylic-acid synthase [Acerihabitans arboris]NDL65272.1 2-succinyl-5-enolpyruvyl-6-hydroxy-3-cyclohexene-1-carboxylic-acid synthase [Acerihabitans arboris]